MHPDDAAAPSCGAAAVKVVSRRAMRSRVGRGRVKPPRLVFAVVRRLAAHQQGDAGCDRSHLKQTDFEVRGEDRAGGRGGAA
jgi:hypothetical protein